MTAVDQVPDQIHAHFGFAGTAPVITEAQIRVAADLPETHEFRQNFDFSPAEVTVILAPDGIPHLNHLGIVQFPLPGIHAGEVGLFDLFRQIRQNVLLAAPEDERRHHAAQPLQGSFLPLFHDRLFQFVPETAVVVQKSRHQVIENGPKLRQTVFDRGAGQSIPGVGMDQFHGFRRSSGMVLDVLGLVDDFKPEPEVAVFLNIPFQQVIGGDQDILILFLPDLPKLPGPGGCSAGDHGGPQVRGEFPHLLQPVVHQRGRADDEGEFRPSLVFCLFFRCGFQNGQGLE